MSDSAAAAASALAVASSSPVSWTTSSAPAEMSAPSRLERLVVRRLPERCHDMTTRTGGAPAARYQLSPVDGLAQLSFVIQAMLERRAAEHGIDLFATAC